MLPKQERSTPHYLWKRMAIPSPSSIPELLHFFLEPLVRRSTTLMSANCTRTRTQLLTTMMLPMHLVAIRKSTTTTNQNRESTKKKKKWLLSDFFKAEMNVEI